MTRPPHPVPTPLPDFDLAAVVELDVRDDLRAGRQPLTRILAAVDALAEGAVLHLRTPFLPTPLIALLTSRGLAFNTHGFANDDWSSWFWRGTISAPVRDATAHSQLSTAGAWDLRPLAAPEPLRLLLERVDSATEAFDALLPGFSPIIPELLADQGWGATVVETADDGVKVHVARIGGPR